MSTTFTGEFVGQAGQTFEIIHETKDDIGAWKDYTPPTPDKDKDGFLYKGSSNIRKYLLNKGDLIEITEIVRQIKKGSGTKQAYEIVKGKVLKLAGQDIDDGAIYYFWIIYEDIVKVGLYQPPPPPDDQKKEDPPPPPPDDQKKEDPPPPPPDDQTKKDPPPPPPPPLPKGVMIEVKAGQTVILNIKEKPGPGENGGQLGQVAPPTDFAQYHVVMTELALEVKEVDRNYDTSCQTNLCLRADARTRMSGRDASPGRLLPNTRYVCYIFQATATSGSGYGIYNPLSGLTEGRGNYIAGHFYIVKNSPTNRQIIWDVTDLPVTDRSGNTQTVSFRLLDKDWASNRPPNLRDEDASSKFIKAPWLEEADIEKLGTYGYTAVPTGTVERDKTSRMYVRYSHGWELEYLGRDDIVDRRSQLRKQGVSEADIISMTGGTTNRAIRLGKLTKFARRSFVRKKDVDREVNILVAEGFWITDPNSNEIPCHILNDD